jgi:hypothetical protein
MLSQSDEYKRLIARRLEENMKSFNLLFGIQHYGNCISIMCQELDQMIRLLFLLNKDSTIRKSFMQSSIESHKWHITSKDNKREYITEETLVEFAKSLKGWDRGIYDFGFAFKSLSNNFNYGSKDPIKSMTDSDRANLARYIQKFHVKDFPDTFTIDALIPVLPGIIEVISTNLKSYLEKI